MPTCFSYNRKHYELNMIGFPLILLIVFGLDRIGLILAWWELDKLGKQTNILQPKHTGTFTHTHIHYAYSSCTCQIKLNASSRILCTCARTEVERQAEMCSFCQLTIVYWRQWKEIETAIRGVADRRGRR